MASEIDADVWGSINALEWMLAHFLLGWYLKEPDPVAAAQAGFATLRAAALKQGEAQAGIEFELAVAQAREEALDRMFSYLEPIYRSLESRSGRG